MTYSIELKPKAVKFLKTVSEDDRDKIKSRILTLAENPRNENVIKVVNKTPDQYRIRQGDYRILFTIEDKKLVVEVIEIVHRRNAYK